MSIPEIVTKETTYYTITLWRTDRDMGETRDTAYKTRRTAYQAAARILNGNKLYKGVTIRRETVYCRNERTEISTSTPIANYDVLRAVW